MEACLIIRINAPVASSSVDLHLSRDHGPQLIHTILDIHGHLLEAGLALSTA